MRTFTKSFFSSVAFVGIALATVPSMAESDYSAFSSGLIGQTTYDLSGIDLMQFNGYGGDVDHALGGAPAPDDSVAGSMMIAIGAPLDMNDIDLGDIVGDESLDAGDRLALKHYGFDKIAFGDEVGFDHISPDDPLDAREIVRS